MDRTRPLLAVVQNAVALLLLALLVPHRTSGNAGTDPPASAAGPTSGMFRAREVTFPEGSSRLAGTVYSPEGDGLRMGMVLLGGSDRGPRGPVKLRLAESLARGGVTVLVYDSPGTGASGGAALSQSRSDRVREALGAVRFLRSEAGLPAGQVGLCGGSEGALIALTAAGADSTLGFVVALSGGFGQSIRGLTGHRIRVMGTRRNLAPEEVARAELFSEILYTLFRGPDPLPSGELRSRAAPWQEETWNEFLAAVLRSGQELPAADQEAVWIVLRSGLERWRNEDWFQLAIVDPGSLDRILALDAPAFFALLSRGMLAPGDRSMDWEAWARATRIRSPVLAVWGEDDEFLPARESFEWLAAYFKEAGPEHTTLRVLPGAGHFLTRVDAPSEYAEGYPELIVDWIASRAP